MEWSHSALQTGQQCWERYRRKYIEGERRPPNARMVRGSAVDRVATESHNRQIKAKADGRGVAGLIESLPSLEEAMDMAATEFDSIADHGLTLTPDDEEAGGEKASRGKEKDSAIALSSMYVEQVAPKVDPIAVQRKTTLSLPDSDLRIVGITDLIDGARGLDVVADNKTAEKTPPNDAANQSQQLTIYALLRMAETGNLPDAVRLDYLIRTPSGSSKHVRLQSTRTTADLQAMIRRINTATALVQKGVFPPTNPTDWMCSPRYCEYFIDCQYTAGRRNDAR